MKPTKVPVDVLRQWIAYDSETGRFQWKAKRIGVHDGRVGWPDDKGYWTLGLFGARIKMHRAAWAIHYGEWPADQIDHINGDRGDNRIVNLRVVTNAENGQNVKVRCDNKSGHQGVYYIARIKRWWAYINLNKRRTNVGYFKSKDEAVAARAAAKKALHPLNNR